MEVHIKIKLFFPIHFWQRSFREKSFELNPIHVVTDFCSIITFYNWFFLFVFTNASLFKSYCRPGGTSINFVLNFCTEIKTLGKFQGPHFNRNLVLFARGFSGSWTQPQLQVFRSWRPAGVDSPQDSGGHTGQSFGLWRQCRHLWTKYKTSIQITYHGGNSKPSHIHHQR